MPVNLEKDASYFLQVQTQTGWGRTLASFAEWCLDVTGPVSGAAMLDVGCGPGLLPALFAQRGWRAYGVDLDAATYAQNAPLQSDQPSLLPGGVLLGADVYALPFAAAAFDLLTASNLLFLLERPIDGLAEMARVLRPGGSLCLLNPSEQMSIAAAQTFADQRGLEELARQTLLNWAARAETHTRWDEPALADLFAAAGLQLQSSALRIGPGLARFGWGKRSL